MLARGAQTGAIRVTKYQDGNLRSEPSDATRRLSSGGGLAWAADCETFASTLPVSNRQLAALGGKSSKPARATMSRQVNGPCRTKCSSATGATTAQAMPAACMTGSSPSEITALKERYSYSWELFDYEGPQHTVRIKAAFAVGRFAVTFDEWDACVADGGCKGYRPSDQGWGRGKMPVVNVRWDDATAYAAWLSRKTGKTYRLLSEAEREYVTRAGTTTVFWWGDMISTSQANYDPNYTFGGRVNGEYRQQTVPVDSFEPNPWDLYNVHGNVWEWCEDVWHWNYDGAPTDGSAWLQGGDTTDHVVRGGSWGSFPEGLRAAVRGRSAADDRLDNLGFRLVRTLTL
jgi:formylglycine-generating enzyme required for sulfatase activity